MAKNDPLGCPFCGGIEVDICHTNSNAYWVQCANDACGAETCSHPTRTDAIANWNRRSPQGSTLTANIRDDDDRDRWTESQKREAA